MFYKSSILLEPPEYEIMIVSVELESRGKLSLIYRPPDKDSEVIRWYTQKLDDIRPKTTATVLAGDYNAYNSESLENKTRANQPGVETLTQGLTQLVKGPTHIKGNRLDLIMSDKPSICSPVSIACQISTSDHYLLTITISVSP